MRINIENDISPYKELRYKHIGFQNKKKTQPKSDMHISVENDISPYKKLSYKHIGFHNFILSNQYSFLNTYNQYNYSHKYQ